MQCVMVLAVQSTNQHSTVCAEMHSGQGYENSGQGYEMAWVCNKHALHINERQCNPKHCSVQVVVKGLDSNNPQLKACVTNSQQLASQWQECTVGSRSLHAFFVYLMTKVTFT